jgi:NAD kinase
MFVTSDGQTGDRLTAADIVRVRLSDRRARLVKRSARSYFDVLREKLTWDAR